MVLIFQHILTQCKYNIKFLKKSHIKKSITILVNNWSFLKCHCFTLCNSYYTKHKNHGLNSIFGKVKSFRYFYSIEIIGLIILRV